MTSSDPRDLMATRQALARHGTERVDLARQALELYGPAPRRIATAVECAELLDALGPLALEQALVLVPLDAGPQ